MIGAEGSRFTDVCLMEQNLVIQNRRTLSDVAVCDDRQRPIATIHSYTFTPDFILDSRVDKVVSPTRRSMMIILSIFLECENQPSRLLIQKHKMSRPLSMTHHKQIKKHAPVAIMIPTSVFKLFVVSASDMFVELRSIVIVS